MPEVLRAWALILLAGAASVSMPQANAPISIRAAQVFDGRGRVQRNVVVTVRGSKIESVAPAAGAVTHDLGSMTLLPGFIDTHVHIGWHIDGGVHNHTECGRAVRQAASRCDCSRRAARTADPHLARPDDGRAADTAAAS